MMSTSFHSQYISELPSVHLTLLRFCSLKCSLNTVTGADVWIGAVEAVPIKAGTRAEGTMSKLDDVAALKGVAILARLILSEVDNGAVIKDVELLAR
jgi:hypothetical protein